MKAENKYSNSDNAKIQEVEFALVLERHWYFQAVVVKDASFNAYDLLAIKSDWTIHTFELKHSIDERKFPIFVTWLNKLVWITTTRAEFWIVETPTKYLFFKTQDLKNLLNDNNLPFKENIWVHWQNRW